MRFREQRALTDAFSTHRNVPGGLLRYSIAGMKVGEKLQVSGQILQRSIEILWIIQQAFKMIQVISMGR